MIRYVLLSIRPTCPDWEAILPNDVRFQEESIEYTEVPHTPYKVPLDATYKPLHPEPIIGEAVARRVSPGVG
jgi:hypothetical protein